MDENQYLTHFKLIAAAGQSRSNSIEAIQTARQGDFDGAKRLLDEANDNLTEAHKIEFTMLQDEANGKPVDVNIVAVHAQDHLTMATVMHDLAEEIVCLYQALSKK